MQCLLQRSFCQGRDTVTWWRLQKPPGKCWEFLVTIYRLSKITATIFALRLTEILCIGLTTAQQANDGQRSRCGINRYAWNESELVRPPPYADIHTQGKPANGRFPSIQFREFISRRSVLGRRSL